MDRLVLCLFGCGCYLVVECYGGVEYVWRYMWSKNVCVVPVIPVFI